MRCCRRGRASPLMNQLRIIYYADSFCGLSETYVYRTAQCLSAVAPMTVLTHERQYRDAFPDGALDIRMVPRPSSRLAKANAMLRGWRLCGVRDGCSLSPRRLWRIAGQPQRAVIFAQFGLAGVRALGAAASLRWPMIVNFHNCDLTNWLAFRRYARNLTRLFRFPYVVFLVPSGYIAAKLIALGAPEARTRVYYNPIPIPDVYRSDSDEKAPLVFLHAGRLVPMKGITYTIKAFARIAAAYDCFLRIIGAGPEEQIARRLARKLGIAGRVTFLGAVDFAAVQREMKGADVFVQHSVTAEGGETEGLPVAICEAMSYQLPIISTRHAGIPEVVKDGLTGLLTAERDIEEMARAMRSLAENRAMPLELGNRGRLAIVKNFSMQAAQSFLEELVWKQLVWRRAPLW